MPSNKSIVKNSFIPQEYSSDGKAFNNSPSEPSNILNEGTAPTLI
jgi:hypothetical protein